MIRNLLMVIMWMSLWALLSLAQVTGRISGSVVDPSGSAVPSAQVLLLMPGGTSAILVTETTSEGIFIFTGVRPGTYNLNVEAKGFAPYNLREVNVDPIRETSLPAIKMALVGLTNVVVVASTTEEVQTGNAEVASTFQLSQIDKFPLLDRDVLGLAQNQAGVVNSSPLTNGSDTVFNGLRSTYTNVTLDGINIQDNYLRENGGAFSPNRLRVSQVAEMTVATSNSISTIGGGAAQVSMVSPSGSNQMHGQAIWYNRTNALAANDWFNNQAGVAAPTLNQNIFGGSIGGPIKKDKLFYYGSYEGARVRQQSTTNNYVLTPDARAGIFTYKNNAGVTQKVNLLNLRNASIDPAVQGILALIPTTYNNFLVGDSSASLLRNTAGYRFNQRDNETSDNLTVKADWNKSQRHTVTGAFHLVREYVDRADASNGFQEVPPVNNNEKVKLFSGSWRYTVNPHLTNELRGGANIAPALFLTTDKPPAFFETNASVTWTSPINEFLPQGRTPHTYTIGDTVSYFRGRHAFQFGVNLQMIRIRAYNDAGIVPGYGVGMGTGQNALNSSDLPGISSSDLSNANTLLASLGGFVNSYSQTFNVSSRTSGFVNGASSVRNWSYNNYAAFIQDQWKVVPRLTMTLGLRYDYFSPVNEQNDLVLMPVVQNNDPVATLMSNATLDFAGNGTSHPIYNKDLNNFAPNVGMAWDMFGNGKTALRAGYSINYVDDNNIATVNNSGNTNSGLQSVSSSSGLSGRLSVGLPSIPVPTFKVPRTAADNYALAPASNAMGLVNPNLRTPYVQQWNFSLEHEFKGNVISVRYVGNHGVKELRAMDYNQVNINPSGFLADFIRARNNGNLARQAGKGFIPAYDATIAGSQPLTVFPLLAAGGLLTNGTVRTYIDQGAIGTLATTYQTNGLNGSLNFFNNPYILGGNYTTNYSSSSYNALQVDVQHRFSKGVQFQANYTWSKVLSDALGDQQSRFEPLLDNSSPNLERARAPYDITHMFHVNGSYDLPFGAGHRWLSGGPILSRLVGGWTIASLVTWQTGAPFSILSTRGTLNRSGNRSAQNTASSNMTADQLKDVVGFYMTGDGPYFINPANINSDGRGTAQEGAATFANQAFSNPGPGTVGNLQRRMFDNPAVFGMDASIQKVTKIREGQSLELRMDAVNVLNHSTFYAGESYNGGTPSTRFSVNATNFGVMGYSFFGRRIIQLGLHLRF